VKDLFDPYRDVSLTASAGCRRQELPPPSADHTLDRRARKVGHRHTAALGLVPKSRVKPLR